MRDFINSDSAIGRGLRTLIQTLIAIVVAVVQVPGVPEAIYKAIQDNALVVVPALTGVVSWIWNLLRSDVDNI